MLSQSSLIQSLDGVQRWVESQNYRGYEPFDGLSSPLRTLTFGNLLAERLLQQLIRQSPWNLRPLLGVSKKDSTKGRGYMAWGYLIRYRTTGDASFLTKAEACLDWLDSHKVSKFKTHSWSNHFDFSSRGGGYTKDDPIIVWTSLIGLAYLEAYEITGKNRWLEIADSVCGWLMALPRERTSTGDCLSYLAFTQSSIHNANMLGAAMLARAAKPLGKPEYQKVAASAMQYSCSRQLSDGSWWYAEALKYHWIDNFHTGYNLSSLKTYQDASGDLSFESNIRNGLAYYKTHFFEENGCPRYYHNRTYPIDIQCASQSVETLAEFSTVDTECLELSKKVAEWTIQNMQDRKGFFYYRQYPMIKARTPMLHWGQATMFKALAQLEHVTSDTLRGPTAKRPSERLVSAHS
jgi:rhamnogalacturonyl hydrolase YesR